jgi:curved DNA-binding protein CbpA
MRELLSLSNSRDILGCRKHFSGDDLNVGYRRAAKRVAPESGGTEGLLRAVNPARDVLKVAS